MGTPPVSALAAMYLQYAWTHLRWVPSGLRRAALYLDPFEQPEHATPHAIPGTGILR